MTNHLVITRQYESLGGLVMSSHQASAEELNPFEQEVVSKFDNIINILHELEEQFSQARQEVLRKSSLEGKEGGKICAIKGRVITNKKKYYRSLEGDMQTLDKLFHDQFSKILRDFSSLKAVSGLEEKPELTPKDITNYPVMPPTTHPELIVPDITSSSPFVKSVALPSIKKVESGKKPTPTGMTPKLVRTPLFRANTISEMEVPKKLDFDKPESIPNPYSIRQVQREKENIPVQEVPLNIPEEESEVETDDNNRVHQVQRVRLGLLKEIESNQLSKAPKVVKSLRGHGFRLSQAQPSSDGRGVLLDTPFAVDDKCNA